jgi:hypothetical protein
MDHSGCRAMASGMAGPFVPGQPGAEPGFAGADQFGQLCWVIGDVGDVDAGVVQGER